MTPRLLAQRSFRFYLRSHLGTIFGAVIATAVLTGALLVGDSVRGSLREMALSRIGRIDHALASGDRLFRSSLATRLNDRLPHARAVGVLQLPGTAATPDGSGRANQVQITGVTEQFWAFGLAPTPFALSNNAVWINDRLARQLDVSLGDTLLLRVPRVSHLSRDAPLSPEEDAVVALRLNVGRILNDKEFGRFGLTVSQIPPLNAFVNIKALQDRANAADQANLLLISSTNSAPLEPESLDKALEGVFTLADAQVYLRPVTNSAAIELRSPRVFLDTQTSEAALAASTNAQPVFTYFVNELRAGDRSTPYSMVAGSTHLVPPGMANDEIVINQWLAEDLGVGPGDEIAISYYVMGMMRELVTASNRFRIRAVVPMELPYADPGLMPDFPGMTDADNCRDWDTGFPIDTEAIRDKDEAYWDSYRGAPKAFVTLEAAQAMWSNRFGNLTAVRYNQGEEGELSPAILEHLQPRDLGFTFQPVRAQALAASSGAQDFGGLFIGFSFFLIAAALMLMSLLFRFSLEQRGEEIGTLLALGFKPGQVKRILLREGFGLAAVGSAIGVACAVLYAKAMLYGLSTIWSDAVAGSTLAYHGNPVTLLAGFGAGLIVAVATIGWSLRTEGKRPARELLTGGMSMEESSAPGQASRASRHGWISGGVLLAAAVGIAAWGLLQAEQARADLFFAAGALALTGGILLVAGTIRRLEFSSAAQQLSLTGMGIRGITRRRKRSRAAVALLACGAFLIASIGAFRLDADKNASQRSSGTGGFELIGESSIPVVHNMNAAAGRDFFGLDPETLADVSFVPFRLLEGEDASCLNLNRAQRPRLFGVNAGLLGERDAFTFSKVMAGMPETSPWLLLNEDLGPGIIPAIGDAASIEWALGKKIGDDLIYLDSNGNEFRVRIVAAVANSILQGSLVISERHFVERFPGESGYRMFLIDAPSNRSEQVGADLTRAMQDAGFQAVSARERLAEFNAVQNTYLGTFQMLGGLGLLLGSFGLGVVLLRNVFERRGELALLQAVGFRRPALRWLILSEHAALLASGLAVGVFAAAIAVLPSIFRPGAGLPYAQLGLTLGAVFLCGLAWTAVAAARALSAPLLKSLRNE